MIIQKKNDGAYVPCALNGSVLSFGGGALTVDLAAEERDWPVALDISADEGGILVLGPAHRYVAQVDIPARTYTVVSGKADDFGFPELSKIPAPLDMDKVTLTLWAQEV